MESLVGTVVVWALSQDVSDEFGVLLVSGEESDNVLEKLSEVLSPRWFSFIDGDGVSSLSGSSHHTIVTSEDGGVKQVLITFVEDTDESDVSHEGGESKVKIPVMNNSSIGLSGNY